MRGRLHVYNQVFVGMICLDGIATAIAKLERRTGKVNINKSTLKSFLQR